MPSFVAIGKIDRVWQIVVPGDLFSDAHKLQRLGGGRRRGFTASHYKGGARFATAKAARLAGKAAGLVRVYAEPADPPEPPPPAVQRAVEALRHPAKEQGNTRRRAAAAPVVSNRRISMSESQSPYFTPHRAVPAEDLEALAVTMGGAVVALGFSAPAKTVFLEVVNDFLARHQRMADSLTIAELRDLTALAASKHADQVAEGFHDPSVRSERGGRS